MTNRTAKILLRINWSLIGRSGFFRTLVGCILTCILYTTIVYEQVELGKAKSNQVFSYY